MQVVATDTATGASTVIARCKCPVLALLPDSHNNVLWVSTTGSDVSAYSIPPAAAPRSASPPNRRSPARRDRGVPNGAPAAALAAEADEAAAQVIKPVVCLQGHPPLVRYAVFDDRRHVLTLDHDGVVALWDVVYGRHTEQFPKGSVRACLGTLCLRRSCH